MNNVQLNMVVSCERARDVQLMDSSEQTSPNVAGEMTTEQDR